MPTIAIHTAIRQYLQWLICVDFFVTTRASISAPFFVLVA